MFRRWLAGKKQAPTTPVQTGEFMVKCAHCGVHIPKSSALGHAGKHYCSVAHRDAATRHDT